MKKAIDKLELALAEIKLKMEEDDDFVDGEEFIILFNKLEILFEEVDAQYESFSFDTANENQLRNFDLFQKRVLECRKRKKQIEDDAGLEDGEPGEPED